MSASLAEQVARMTDAERRDLLEWMAERRPAPLRESIRIMRKERALAERSAR